MTQPTNVNSQITDAVTQTNVQTTGESPAEELAKLNEAEESESEEQTSPRES